MKPVFGGFETQLKIIKFGLRLAWKSMYLKIKEDVKYSPKYSPKDLFPSDNFPRVFSQVQATSQMCNFPRGNLCLT